MSGQLDLIEVFMIDRYALRYFGIIRFLDRPGYFPQLRQKDAANVR
jgi:hypothetical protein